MPEDSDVMCLVPIFGYIAIQEDQYNKDIFRHKNNEHLLALQGFTLKDVLKYTF
jgi:hypothetical protein